MKKNGKLLITFGLIITMLFGNIMTLYAKTTNSVLADLSKYFTYINTASAVFATVNNKTYDYTVFTWKSDKPCYVTYVENPSPYMEQQGLNGGYAGTFLIVSNESEIQWGYNSIKTDEKGIEECLNRDITLEKKGWTKTIQDENGQDWYIYEIGLTIYRPINSYDFMMLRTEHTLKEFINLLFTGTLDGNVDITGSVTPDDINRNFYLKNIGYTVRAENSSEYPDETFIKFTWDTNNLKSGDVLEVKTRNHYTKIGGDQVIGFHDYITYMDGISCYTGSYEMSQTDAVKAWFKTIEYKPLIFKDYDTDIYFLRPVRSGEYFGLWAKVTMIRKTPTSSPIVKDVEYGDLSTDGEWVKNDDITISEGGNHGIDQDGNIILPDDVNKIPNITNIADLFKYLFGQLGNLISMFGQLPSLINATIGWLPSSIIILICSSIVIVIILRIFGR